VKRRLIAGTINRWPSDGVFANYHLDVSPRPVWDRELEMGVLPDFVLDIGADGGLADFREAMFDEVRCHHVLEHLPPAAVTAAIRGFARILQPGGVLDVEVPDLDRVATAYLAGDLDLAGARQWLLGEQLANHEPSDSHRSAWTEPALRGELEEAGFRVPSRQETGLALRFVAVKP
jgi:SAM-dependent methyltransferase